LDIEKLAAGRFDDRLLDSVKQAKHFILVLSKDALERCVNDDLNKDWVHKVSAKHLVILISSEIYTFIFIIFNIFYYNCGTCRNGATSQTLLILSDNDLLENIFLTNISQLVLIIRLASFPLFE